MAFSVERAMAKAAAALLPALLPTPPSMITSSPCLIILPSSSNPKFPKPGRADSAERWDAHKKPGSPASSCGSASSGRADSVERWDINKKRQSAGSSSSSSTSSSTSSQGSSSSTNPGRAPSSQKRPPSRASSADRWDVHKKHLAAAQRDADQDKQKIVDKEDETSSKKMMATVGRTQPVFSGPCFVASPEPGMLPMPAFFPRRAGVIPLPAFVQAQ